MKRTSTLLLTLIMSLAGKAQANTPVTVGPNPHGAGGIVTLNEVQGPLTLFLNLDGAKLSAGRGGSHHNESLVMLAKRIGSMAVPRYSGSAADRQRLIACVKDTFSRYRMEIVTSRPSAAPYIMAVAGGRSSGLGLSRRVTGIAPYNGGVMSEAVVFAFERGDRGPISVCNTVAHEVGHALGLRHAYKRGELMSYLSYSGQKSFMNSDASCGEWRARTCASGKASQNSHQHLASILGLKGTGPGQRPAPDADPVQAPPPASTRVAGTQKPANEPPASPQKPARVATVAPPGHQRPAAEPAPGPNTVRRPRAQPAAKHTYRVRVNFVSSNGQTTRKVTCTGSNLALVAHCLGDNGLKLVTSKTADGKQRLTVKPITRAAPGQDRHASRRASPPRTQQLPPRLASWLKALRARHAARSTAGALASNYPGLNR